MPIEVKVVSKEDFDAWVAQKKASASLETPTTNIKLAQVSSTNSGAAR